MIDHNILVRWKALADKSLDEGSPEPERLASMRALAKEVAKTLAVDAAADTIPSTPFSTEEWSPPRGPGWGHPNSPENAFDPRKCGACNHDADSHTAHARNGTCFECELHGRVCTRTRNEILQIRPENEPQFGRPTRARR